MDKIESSPKTNSIHKWSNLFIIVGLAQFVASIDEGKTIHGITVASPQLLNGTYSFVGNGLIMHNIENNPFWISYSVSYKEMKMIADK